MPPSSRFPHTTTHPFPFPSPSPTIVSSFFIQCAQDTRVMAAGFHVPFFSSLSLCILESNHFRTWSFSLVPALLLFFFRLRNGMCTRTVINPRLFTRGAQQYNHCFLDSFSGPFHHRSIELTHTPGDTLLQVKTHLGRMASHSGCARTESQLSSALTGHRASSDPALLPSGT